MSDRRVVFSTTGIISEEPSYPGQPSVYEEVFRGENLKWYSTGRLEEALGRDLDVYICSIRPAFGPHDMWWRRLVDPQKVFCALEMRQGFQPADGMKVMLAPWKRLYGRLRLAWSEDFTDPEQARAAMQENGIIDGNVFRGFRGGSS